MTAAEALKHKWIQMQVVGADARGPRITVREENVSVKQRLQRQSDSPEEIEGWA